MLRGVIAFVILLVVGLLLAVYFGVKTTREIVEECYTQERVALSVIEHMKTHDGAWPAGWEDVGRAYERVANEDHEHSWSLDDMRRRVEIDWKAEPDRLLESAKPDDRHPFKVIWLRDGRDVHWTGGEPNQMILEYLRSRADGDAKPGSATN